LTLNKKNALLNVNKSNHFTEGYIVKDMTRRFIAIIASVLVACCLVSCKPKACSLCPSYETLAKEVEAYACKKAKLRGGPHWVETTKKGTFNSATHNFFCADHQGRLFPVVSPACNTLFKGLWERDCGPLQKNKHAYGRHPKVE